MSSLSDEPPKTQDRTFQAQYFRPWDISRGVTLIPNRWLRYKGLALTAKLVYWVMARFSHGKTYCFVKAKTIARELCLNRSTVIEAQRQLVEKRFLQRQRRGQGRSIYHFLRHPILDHTFPDEADDAEHGESDHDGNVTDAQPPSATVRNATTIPLQSSEIQKSGNPSSRNRNPQLREVGSADHRSVDFSCSQDTTSINNQVGRLLDARSEKKPPTPKTHPPVAVDPASSNTLQKTEAPVMPTEISIFRIDCLEILKGRGLGTPPKASWWQSLWDAISDRNGHPDHFLECLTTRAHRVTAYGFLKKLVDDVADGREYWEETHPVKDSEAECPP